LEAILRRLVLVYHSLPLNRDDKPHDFNLNFEVGMQLIYKTDSTANISSP